MAATCSASVVQLGVYDSPCPSQRLSPFENKIGGYPDFFANCVLESPPSCRCCGGPLALLAQVYCPHDGSPYHRLLHVYCCCQPHCWAKSESWSVLRSQLKDLSYEVKPKENSKSSSAAVTKEKLTATAKEWCEDVDDWGDDGCATGESGEEEEQRCSCYQIVDASQKSAVKEIVDSISQVEDLVKVMTVKETTSFKPNSTYDDTAHPVEAVDLVSSSYEGPFYPAGFVSVVEDPGASTFEAEELLKRYKGELPPFDVATNGLAFEHEARKKVGSRKGGQKEKTGHKGNVSGGGELYEKGVARHGDKSFQKFHKHLSNFPQQILRYSWKGIPLLFSRDPAHMPPKEMMTCRHCGAACVFELQLMPPLVYFLNQSLTKARVAVHKPPEDSMSQLTEKVVEFGTVLLYSCSASCWEENLIRGAQFKEETVVVQPDTDTLNRFN